MLASDLCRPGQRGCGCRGKLPGQRRERRLERVRAELRRDGAGAQQGLGDKRRRCRRRALALDKHGGHGGRPARSTGNKAQPTIFRGRAASFADKKVQNGLEYVYSVQAYDQADNASKPVSAVGLPKVLTLRKTPYTPRAASKPVLRWDAARGASYYHVQLFRGAKRILAAWPNRAELVLPAAWRWAGHRYSLSPGRYRWYVWEGLGRRSFARYKSVGSASFIVPRR